MGAHHVPFSLHSPQERIITPLLSLRSFLGGILGIFMGLLPSQWREVLGGPSFLCVSLLTVLGKENRGFPSLPVSSFPLHVLGRGGGSPLHPSYLWGP